MYAKVPSDLKEPLLKEMRQLRIRSAFKHFPALVLIFSAIAALVIMVKGQAIIRIFRDYVPSSVSDTTLIIASLVVVTVIAAAVLAYFLSQEYKECDYQECLYCAKCDAVDNFDSGHCPICGAQLNERAWVYFTGYRDEQRILEKWGLQPCKVAKAPTVEET